jgi:hypothetical protein
MTTIVATQATSILNNGVYHNGENFIDKYNNILENRWVVYCFWSNQNSKFGCDIADLRTNKFCLDYGIEIKI